MCIRNTFVNLLFLYVDIILHVHPMINIFCVHWKIFLHTFYVKPYILSWLYKDYSSSIFVPSDLGDITFYLFHRKMKGQLIPMNTASDTVQN